MNSSKNRNFSFVRVLIGPLVALSDPRERTQNLDRWTFGHGVFVVLDQLQNVVLVRAHEFIQSSNSTRVNGLLREVDIIQRASGVAVKLTSNFDVGVYEAQIRPHMAAYEPDMSGLYMRDHQELCRTMKETVEALLDSPIAQSCDHALRHLQLGRAVQGDYHAEACRRNLRDETVQSMKWMARHGGSDAGRGPCTALKNFIAAILHWVRRRSGPEAAGNAEAGAVAEIRKFNRLRREAIGCPFSRVRKTGEEGHP